MGQSNRFSTNKSVLTSHEGWVEFEAEIFNGKKCGIGRWFHKNGRLRFEGEYVNDKPNGECVTIFYNNGNLEYQGKMVEGRYTGWGKLFHPNGQLWYHGEFADNVPTGEECVLYKKKREIAYDGKIDQGKTEEGKYWHNYF
jgi:antitoxin component YwqK of YwqJK toxin-antitoxin module